MTIGEACRKRILELCKDKRVSVNVISKSGTTTESALAFRFVRSALEKRWPKGLQVRILCATPHGRVVEWFIH